MSFESSDLVQRLNRLVDAIPTDMEREFYSAIILSVNLGRGYGAFPDSEDRVSAPPSELPEIAFTRYLVDKANGRA